MKKKKKENPISNYFSELGKKSWKSRKKQLQEKSKVEAKQ